MEDIKKWKDFLQENLKKDIRNFTEEIDAFWKQELKKMLIGYHSYLYDRKICIP